MKNVVSIQKLLSAASVFFIFITAIPFLFIALSLKGVDVSELLQIVSYYRSSIVTTILLSVTTGSLALLFSVLALISLLCIPTRYHKPVSFVLSIPLIFPPYIAAISYISIFKSPLGLSLLGRSQLTEFWQASMVLSLFLYPYSFLLLKNRLEMIDPAHKKIISLYRFRLVDKLRLLYIPHLKGVLLTAFVIPFMYVIADFGAVSILRMDTVTTELYQSMVRRFEYEQGALLSLFLLLLSTGTLVMGARFTSRPVESLRSNESELGSTEKSKYSQALSVLCLILLILLSFGVPAFQIIRWFIQFIREQSVLKDVWFAPDVLLSMTVTTVIVSLIVVAVSQMIVFGVQMLQTLTHKTGISSVTYFLSSLLHALPAIVIAFSVMIIKFSTPFSVSHALVFLFLAYILRFIGIAFLTTAPAIEAIPKGYLRIGDSLVPRFTERIRLILFPYIKKYLLQSGNYMYFLSLRELTIPLILLPLGMNVLSVRIWQTASEGLYVYASPMILVLLLLSLPSLVWYIKSQL